MLDATDVHVEMATGTFPRHLGARLLSERRAARRPLWVLASRSQGRFTIRDLRDAEAGLLPLEPDTVVALGQLYGVQLGSVLPPTGRGLDVREGEIAAGGVTVEFVPGDGRSMVAAYFRLVRTLRAIEHDAPVGVRHDDLVEMVHHLTVSQHRSSVLERVLAMANAEGRVVVASLLASTEALGLDASPTESTVTTALK
ncbi:MAG: hypothetical protein U0Q03_20110 [Acidimicrobiales bacterium]